MTVASEAVREGGGGVFRTAFCGRAGDIISELLGLRPESVGRLRSGRLLSRLDAGLVMGQRWLIWQAAGDGSIVGAAILRRQQHRGRGAASLQGGFVLEYVVASRTKGAKGYLMVLAAEEICRSLGAGELFSACDLSQVGQNGLTPSAVDAHRRWGFRDVDPLEWKDRSFHEYTRKCRVKLMVKPVSRG